MTLAVSDVEVCTMGEKDTDTVWAAKDDRSMSRGVAMLCVCVWYVCVCARACVCMHMCVCIGLICGTLSIKHSASFPGLPRFHLLFTEEQRKMGKA